MKERRKGYARDQVQWMIHAERTINRYLRTSTYFASAAILSRTH